MHRNIFPTLILSALAVLLPAQLPAQPLIIAQPTSKNAFVGDANVTFQVLAAGTDPAYQWQISTNGGTNWSNLTETTPYSGTATANLTIIAPNLSLNTTPLTEYRVKVAESSAPTVNATSLAASLTVFSTPSIVPIVTITGTGVNNGTATIAANSTANITITVSNLTTGDTIRLQRFLDSNGNGKPDPGELLVESFALTDGHKATFGGVTDPNIPGDDDGAANGSITTHITLPSSPEMGRLTGNYIIKVVSPSGEFSGITKNLTVTQPSYANKITGQVTSGGTGVPHAGVGLLQQTASGDQNLITGNVTDANGNYTIFAAPGTYTVLPLQLGYVSAFSDSAQPTLISSDLPNTNVTVSPASATYTAAVNNTTGGHIQGMQFFIQAKNEGLIAIADSDSSGYLNAPLTALSDWQVDMSDASLALTGFIRPQNKPTLDLSSGNITASSSPFNITPANALIYGTFKDSHNNAIAGVIMDANDDSNMFNPNADTDSSGTYYFPAYGPVNSGGNVATNWNVSPDGNNPALTGFIPPQGQNAQLFSGQSAQLNFTAVGVTAYLNGTVRNNGTPVSGAIIDAILQNSGNGGNVQIQNTTDSNGNFNLGVSGGNWTLQLDQGSSDGSPNNPNLVGQSLNESVTDNVNINSISFAVLTSTGIISGNVHDAGGNPVTNNGVNGSATISGVNYSSGVQLDNTGNYSFPVVNGNWTVGLSAPGFTSQNVTVNGSAIVNFVQSIIGSQPVDENVNGGESLNFSVGTVVNNTNFQWQLSTNNGSSWGNISDNTLYSGSNSQVLNLSTTTNAMDGYQYRCILSATVGSTPVTQTTNAATLHVSPTFLGWQEQYFNQSQLNDPNTSGETADPAKDGIPNLVKYAFNLSPFQISTTGLPQAHVSAGILSVTFPLPANDLNYTVEVSNDMTDWGTVGVTTQISSGHVTAFYTLTGHTKAFFRILISQKVN